MHVLEFGGSTSHVDTNADNAVSVTQSIGSDTNENGTVIIDLVHPAQTRYTRGFFWSCYEANNGTFRLSNGAFLRNAVAVVNAVRFQFSSGNISAGNLTVYGMKI